MSPNGHAFPFPFRADRPTENILARSGEFSRFFSEPSSKRTGKAAASLGGNFFRAEEDDDAAIRFGILK